MEKELDTVLIRQAVADDEEWITDLMERVLTPYYDGDNRAHARRIVHAHLAGGHDAVGFFSHEQRTFVAVVNGKRAGIIHLVGKRQQTYKISPLIVSESFRGMHGLGSKLLDHAIEYAKAASSRQIYCTVAEANRSAMAFFLRKGFIRAGSSDSHYKVGSTEVMLYKQLYDTEALVQMDRLNISVLPFDVESDASQVRTMILRTIPADFDGVDDAWVDALFAGYCRRHTQDINLKYKLIYVAKDSSGTVLGVAGATPKKGTPIKLMPFIAETQQAFDAMLCELPNHLVTYGRKLYLHISPTVPQVLSMQRHGWKIDAAMPGAYRPDVVTQQWSLDVPAETMRIIRVKRPFFDHICSRQKTLEVRVGYDSIKRIQKGDQIRFVTHDASRDVRVSDIRTYASFSEMLAVEDYRLISPESGSSEEVHSILRGFYDDAKEHLGVVVLQLAVH